MKAVVMTAVKEPFTTREIPDPQPAAGQVRIRLHATDVCGTDTYGMESCLSLCRLFLGTSRLESSIA